MRLIYTNCDFLGSSSVQVISEEHTENPDWTDVPLPNLENEDISKGLISDQNVKAEDVTIWIDPLDASKEGGISTLIFLRPDPTR
jgi:hypothetical protein